MLFNTLYSVHIISQALCPVFYKSGCKLFGAIYFIPGYSPLAFIHQTGRKDPLCRRFQDEKVGKRGGSRWRQAANQGKQATLPMRTFCFARQRPFELLMLNVPCGEGVSDGNRKLGRERKEGGREGQREGERQMGMWFQIPLNIGSQAHGLKKCSLCNLGADQGDRQAVSSFCPPPVWAPSERVDPLCNKGLTFLPIKRNQG